MDSITTYTLAFVHLPKELAWMVLYLWMQLDAGTVEIKRRICEGDYWASCYVDIQILVCPNFVLFNTNRPDNSVYIEYRPRWPKVHGPTWTPAHWLVSVFSTGATETFMQDLCFESPKDCLDFELVVGQTIDHMFLHNKRVLHTFTLWCKYNKVYS